VVMVLIKAMAIILYCSNNIMLMKLMVERSVTIVIHNVPPPLPPQVSVAPPSRTQVGGDILACGGRGDPIPTKGQTLWYSTVCIL
jgi:hypothetical protein